MNIKTKDIGFFIGYVFFLIGQLLGHTMIPIPSQARYVLISIGILFLFMQIAFSAIKRTYGDNISLSKKIIIFLLLFFIFSIISTVRSNEPIILLDFLFILGAKDVEFDKILKIFIFTASALLIFTVISNVLGFIQTSYIQRGNVVRYTFGYRFPTDFVQLIVYILLADLTLCIKDKSAIFLRIIIYIFLGFFTLIYSDARLGSGTIFLLVPASIVLKYGKKIISSRIIQMLEKYIFLLCTVFSIFIMNKFISGGSSFMATLDKFTSYRLTNTDMGIKFFGYTIWGQQIYNNIDQFFKGWFYIDSSYYVFLLEYGIGLLILVEIGYIWSMNRSIRLRNYIIPFICMFIALDSLIDQQFYLLEYNVFLLVPLANLGFKFNKDSKELA
ncbi:hypothetical protein [Lactobacillus crispatus]|uniref:Polysaccharide polymerase n=1 Tax=Lactobacillus crispatus TaxID=47770 RepID=A0A7H9EBY0_9LACO|nr:hypothetical protein [Lactobacillus crispatus]QLL74725.1 hypothetical protein GTO85_10490 [Lactobacillus crispatus]